jgi:hypothetical protein
MERWRGVNNAVLYSVQFRAELNDAVVDRIARAVLNEPLWDLTPQQEYEALAEALQSDAQLTALIPEKHSEETYRDFLRRLLARLDEIRPWPELPFQELSKSRWESFASARPAARITLGFKKMQERLHRGLAKLDDSNRRIVMLRLRSGDEVALVTPWWPGSDDTAMLQRESGRPAEQVVAQLINDTGLTADEVTPLDGLSGPH